MTPVPIQRRSRAVLRPVLFLMRRYHVCMPVGRLLIFSGLVLLVAGIIVTLGGRFFPRVGHLPGDIVIRGKNSSFYFPIVTCILISVVLSLVLSLFRR